jgi:hypothetical protein
METPPQGPDSGQQFVAYPRPNQIYGSADRLQALADGYYGLSNVFVLNLVLAFGINFGRLSMPDPGTNLLFLGVALPILGLVVAFASYPYNKKIVTDFRAYGIELGAMLRDHRICRHAAVGA